MNDTSQDTAGANSTIKVLAALAELGEATAAAVAEQASLGYSTTTPKLRAWEEAGHAERFRTDDGRTLWRLTAAGRAATASDHCESGERPAAGPAASSPTTIPETGDEGSRTETGTPAAPTPSDLPAGDQVETAEAATDADTPATRGTTALFSADRNGISAITTDLREQESDRAQAAEPPSSTASTVNSRRAGGSLRGAILDILQAHPDRQYKIRELCRLIDDANAGTGAAKASAGAVANAVIKLAAAGTVVQTVEQPATFQLAPINGG